MSDELTERIIGAAIEVYRFLSPGLLESIYEEALCHEFFLRGLQCERQVGILVYYKGKTLQRQRLDMLVEGQVVVELKSLSYLKATGLHRALLINFGQEKLVDGTKRISL